MAEDQQVFKRNIKEIDEVNDAIKTTIVRSVSGL